MDLMKKQLILDANITLSVKSEGLKYLRGLQQDKDPKNTPNP